MRDPQQLNSRKTFFGESTIWSGQSDNYQRAAGSYGARSLRYFDKSGGPCCTHAVYQRNVAPTKGPVIRTFSKTGRSDI